MSNLNRNREFLGLALGVAILVLLPSNMRAQSASAAPPGALVRMDMHSVVGVQLDEIPMGAQREEAAEWVLSQEDAFWEKRAATQVNLIYLRLVFRSSFYTALVAPRS